MLRLLLSLFATAAMTPLPIDHEPKPQAVENGPRPKVGEPAAMRNDVGGSAFFEYVDEPARSDSNPNVSFTGFGQTITLKLLPDDSDLVLVEPDAALRAQLKLPPGRGLVAGSVREGSPAWQAGVRPNDVLLSLDDAPLAKPNDLDAKLKQAGEKPMTLAIVRKGAPVSLKVRPQVKVGLGPVEREEAPTYWIGVNVSTIGPALRAQLDVPKDRGLLVASVVDGSPASKGGLKANDVLLTVAGKPLGSQQALSECVQKNGETPIEVECIREGARNIVVLRPEKRTTGQTFRVEFAEPARIGTTVVRPGVLQNGYPVVWTETPSPLASIHRTPGNAPDSDASARRIDDMAAEIKELHKAIDALRKALEDRK